MTPDEMKSLLEWAREFSGPGSAGVNELADALEAALSAHPAEEAEWEYGWKADEAVRATLSPRGPRVLFDDQPNTPEAIAAFPRGQRIRRRKAGPWSPVPTPGGDS